ncbi:hypothetical protein [Phytoactinopolyspora endophytica]|uniref:hypothetical protein n=1 Tax=Phytoactinopolyspora endophytica TaxID=1642495 RepID=UPI00101C902B|nr:hypothetical protein [Phytoactinopolyspora endophytica]
MNGVTLASWGERTTWKVEGLQSEYERRLATIGYGPELILPVSLKPRWIDTPRHAWTVSRAWSAGCRPELSLALAVCALPWWLGVVAGARAVGQLAAVDTRASAIVSIVGKSYPARAAISGAVCLAIFIALGAIVEVVAAVYGYVTGHATPYATYVGRYVSIWLLVLGTGRVAILAASSFRSKERRRLRRYAGELQIEQVQAWPQRTGHGARLWRQLQPALTAHNNPFVVRARSVELARVYERWAGLTAVEDDSLVMRSVPPPGDVSRNLS